ncbi:MAG: helix-turn-helix domain-containing protein [Clostridia bacterium]|jgi:transcriptional regulator with XRE-family HTH domain
MSSTKTKKLVNNEITERLKQVIGKDKKEFALKVGISYEAIRTWCKGIYFPSGDQLIKIKELTGVDLNWLVTGIKEEKVFPSESSQEILMLLQSFQKQIDGLQRQIDVQLVGIKSLEDSKKQIKADVASINSRLFAVADTGELKKLMG